MLPLLVVCYLRPVDLTTILEMHIGSARRIYVFIDRTEDGSPLEDLNQEVLNVAMSFQEHLDLRIFHSESNLGVGRGVPRAVEWISNQEDLFIVLEDDCHLNKVGFEYFDREIQKLSNQICIISATSPWDLEPVSQAKDELSLSNYPLISGWATSSINWKQISQLIGEKPPYLKAFTNSLRSPAKARAIMYFLAAQMRTFKGDLRAWDCSLALAMLLSNRKALIPNITMVTNTGRDQVASHTIPNNNQDNIFRMESAFSPSLNLGLSTRQTKLTDRQIEKKCYIMRWRHVLSPVKALVSWV
jgi:hypothetical protein